MTVDVIGLVQKMVGGVQKHRLIEQAPLSLFPAFALFSLSPPSPPPPIFALDTQEPPIRPDACLRRKFLHLPDRISIFNWLKKVCDKCLSIPISVSVRQTTYDDIFYL